MDSSTQQNLFESGGQATGPVECLGLTFENDEVRRSHFLAILREQLKDPEFRKIEGFPIGEDEDILALSDPPYYTACPNPFLEDFIRCYGKPYDPETDDYHREPFAADVSEGKNDPIYNAHSYHTKVPHKAIMRYILHYTEPGDIVFDGFCGTGMTGVEAQLCGDRKTVESLGYTIQKNYSDIKLGTRKAILCDISPIATFISSNYNLPADTETFKEEAQEIYAELQQESGWSYLTLHTADENHIKKGIQLLNNPNFSDLIKSSNLPLGIIKYTIWSDIFICPECASEIVFWDVAVDKELDKVKENFLCPHCSSELQKNRLERSFEASFDKSLGKVINQVKVAPALYIYEFSGKRYEKKPDRFDQLISEKVDSLYDKYWFPTNRMPMGQEARRNDRIGITHTHHFFTKQNLMILSSFYEKAKDRKSRSLLMLSLTSLLNYSSRLSRWRTQNKSGPLSGTLYISSTVMPLDAFTIFPNRFKRMQKAKESLNSQALKDCILTTQSSTRLNSHKDNSIDYIFTDPPFGGNLMYSELSFLWEEWIKVITSSESEAVENKAVKKTLADYQKIMSCCFRENYRLLKPGRWMTVEFHNSKNSVWNTIQEALQSAGFVVADVRVLDKKQGTFKQVSNGGAVKQDLVISAYKPSQKLEIEFQLSAGTLDGVWNFISTHLQQLPVFVINEGHTEVVAERQNYLLFDRMVAFHIQRGVTVPLSASEFYAGLDQRFPKRDGIYFLPDQIAEYDRKRMTVKEVLQLDLFVNDESTAVQWLRQQLTKKPQTFQELHPGFLKAISGWAKHETTLELSDLLEQNFLRYDGGNIPRQIVSWLAKSSVHRVVIAKVLGQESGVRSQESGEDEGQTAKLLDLVPDTGLETRDAGLLAAARDRWYIPDPNKAGDLEKLREKALLKEFEEYRTTTKKLKVFRMEAMRTGFKHYFQLRDYKIIIQVARKVPDTVLQEDPKLLMFYDNAVTRAGEE